MNFLKEISRPVTLVGYILAIAGICATAFFYFKNIRKREPFYTFTNPQKIFDSKKSTPSIKVFDGNKKLVEDDVYVLFMIVWNNGELPINKEDVRKPVKIKFGKVKRIIEFEIIEESHPDISKFKLEKLSKDALSNSNSGYKLSWEYFDSGFAAKMRLLYSGTNEINIEFDGYILDAEVFKEIEYSSLLRGKEKYRYLIQGVISMIFIIFGFIIYKRRRKRDPGFFDGGGTFFIYMYIIILLFAGFVGFYYAIMYELLPSLPILKF